MERTQVLAHVAEIQVFWVKKAVLITKEHDPQITRSNVENDQRLEAVAGGSQAKLEVLRLRVMESCEKAIALVGGLDQGDLNHPGHREENPITAGGVVQYVARHVRDHARQITEARWLIRQQS